MPALSAQGWAACLFALYSTLSMLLMATVLPPYQNPDEAAHFARADEIMHLGWISRRDRPIVDSGVDAAGGRFSILPHHEERRATRDLYASVPWGGPIPMAHDNTAMYPPVFYLPGAVAIRFGQAVGLTVLPTLELARAATGMLSIALGTAAIVLADSAAIWLFAILTLPMTLAQMGAMGQDGPLICAAALATALLVRLQTPLTRHAGACLIVLVLLLACIGIARPPYAALSFLLLLPSDFPRRLRIALTAGALGATIAWSLIVLRMTGLYPGLNGANVGAQIDGLLTAPWRVATVAAETCRIFTGIYLETFIGVLGSMDVWLPLSYRYCACAILALAAATSVVAGRGFRSFRPVTLTLATIAAACLGIFAVQYLTWTPVGAPRVEGVQGRYFIPLALVVGSIVARSGTSGDRLAKIMLWPIGAFPIVTISVSMTKVFERYFF